LLQGFYVLKHPELAQEMWKNIKARSHASAWQGFLL
jgi:hypothetical protein